MARFFLLATVLALCAPFETRAAWWLPWESDAGETNAVPGVATLLEPASDLIDLASIEASTGAVERAIATYERALASLEAVERRYPDRAQSAEFASLRNKRSYVTAAITSLRLDQSGRNARTIAVCDTRALEKQLDKERLQERAEARRKVVELLSAGKTDEAERVAAELYADGQDDVATLTLCAAVKAVQGRNREARSLLAHAIEVRPEDHVTYYNMARFLIQANKSNRQAARAYYEDGRSLGGPEDRKLEALIR